MEASVTLWEKWHEQVKDLLPGVQGHQKKTLALCALGITLSQSAVLQRMAEGIALAGISSAKMVSIERRLARFIANERVQVSTIWKQLLEQMLAYWKGPRDAQRDGTHQQSGFKASFLTLLLPEGRAISAPCQEKSVGIERASEAP